MMKASLTWRNGFVVEKNIGVKLELRAKPYIPQYDYNGITNNLRESDDRSESVASLRVENAELPLVGFRFYNLAINNQVVFPTTTKTSKESWSLPNDFNIMFFLFTNYNFNSSRGRS